jgi:hypothetical protein
MVMTTLTVLLAVSVVLAGIGTSDAAVRIVEDSGGRIRTYVDRYEGVRSAGENVVIDGYCVSACTIVLGTVPHDKICVTRRARLRISRRLGSRLQPSQNNQFRSNAESVFDVSI